MDPIMLSRIQYALTTIFHFFFVPLSIGLVLLVAIMETLYVVKGKEIYKTMAKFWGKLFLINFAVGVVTGILQEFQFGMNWSSTPDLSGTCSVRHWLLKRYWRFLWSLHLLDCGYLDGIVCPKECIWPASGWCLSAHSCPRCGFWQPIHLCNILLGLRLTTAEPR